MSSNEQRGEGKGCLAFKAILLDIEGTTTSISFVKDVLFPYAAKNAQKFLCEVINACAELDPLVDSLIDLSNEEHLAHPEQVVFVERAQLAKEPEKVAGQLAQNVRLWIEQDKKLTALKQLQGRIWERAYETGEVKSHIYPDVPVALERLNSLHIPIHIYSSGSEHAQKLLFAHTQYGDLTQLIKGYFDTKVGPKREGASYGRIAEEIGIQPADILFVTDVDKEALAASGVGMQVLLSIREGNAALSEEVKQRYDQISSLADILS